MGFFSNIKKLWDKPEDLVEQAAQEHFDKTGDAPAALKEEPEVKSEPAPKPAEQAPAPVQKTTQPVEETAPKPTPTETAPIEAAPVAAPPVTEAAPEPIATPEPVHVPDTEGTAVIAEENWQKELTIALRQAEPRLSIWLEHILDGVSEPGDDLWNRLTFLFQALEAPQEEAQKFITDFEKWLDNMGYEEVEEFRSELQYRLALALELEDEEDEKDRLFLKLSEGLSKTKEQISKRIDGLLDSHSSIDEDFWDELEEILIMADIGFDGATMLMDNLKERVRKAGTTDIADFRGILQDELEEIFSTPKRIKAYTPPEVVMMIGVNGVGKTTTIAKLAYRAKLQGRKVLIAAGDTFRAAAIDQLRVWAERIEVDFYAKPEGSDPAAVAFEAMDEALKGGYDLLLLDTAGRLHTKTNLMEELKKIRRVVDKKHEGAPHRSILVVDATTGQNALSQTKLFNEAVGIDEIILTKLDGTAKGGVVVSVTLQHQLPITFVGLGEKMEDLRPFDGQDFAKALLMP
ncbi:MAG: signal recognition particle-docking protein FtsY [Desulfovibrio sp.]